MIKNINVTVVGGINIDVKAKAYGELVAKSSNPGSIKVTAGGVGRNIAHNLALLGVPVTFLSVIGTNDEGLSILEQTAAAGVNTDHVLRLGGLRTGTYIALLDSSGEMELAVSDMEILEHLTVEYLQSKSEILKNSAYIICDTNIPAASVKYLVELAASSGIPICAEPVSVAKAMKLKDMLCGISLVTPNRDELEALAGMSIMQADLEQVAQGLVAKGVANVLVTLGKDGICLINAAGAHYYQSYETQVLDVTGAGDSLTAGLIYGLLKYGDMDAACRTGLAAAAVTVASKETVSKAMNESNVLKVVASGIYKEADIK